MKILEIKSINNGSTDYVCNMITKEFLQMNLEVSIVQSVRSIFKNPFKWYGFYKNCKKNDILHTHLGKASQFTPYFKNKNINVATLHGFQKVKHYKNCDYFTAVSSAVKKHFVEQGINEDKIRVIPNGIKTELLDIDLERNNKIITIAQIGHLTKNLDFTFNIIFKLKKLGYNFKFIFVGDQGNIEIIKNKVKELQIEDFVEFLGFINEIESVYKKIDILFSSSKLEGFCLPILEAMASGLPVVTYDSKGINDYFLDNENGYIFTSETEALFSLEKLINNKNLRIEIGKFNKEKAKFFTWDKIAIQYYEYFRILKEKN